MKLSVEPKKFKKFLELAVKATNPKDSVYSHLLIETVSPTQIKMLGGNEYVTETVLADATVIQDGKMCVRGDTLLAIFKTLKEETELELIGGYLIVTCANAKQKLPAVSSDHLSEILREVQVTNEHTVDVETLVSMVKRTAIAMSEEETQYELNGIQFEAKDGELKIIGTDGGRVALATTEFDGVLSFLAPKKALTNITKLPKGDVALEIVDGALVLSTDSVQLQVNKLDGVFPDYTEISDLKFTHNVAVNYAELKEAISRLKIADDEIITPLAFSFKPDELHLSVDSPFTGELEETLPSVGEGEAEFSLDLKFVQDFVKENKTSDVYVYFNKSAKSPVRFTAGASDYSYTVMPLKT